MSFERPQKGNPYQITTDQHFHMAHCVGRFAKPDGKVEVRLVSDGTTKRVGKRSKVFCGLRSWDERAEKGYMHSIEEAFLDELDRTINGVSATPRSHEAISR